MTERQEALIRRLVRERELPATNDETGATIHSEDATRTTYVMRWLGGVAPNPDARQASALIEWLLGLPVRGGEAPPSDAAPGIEVAAGRYALVGEDGTIKFYAVDRPTEGRWAGYTFVNALGSDERYPIRNRDARDRVLRGIAADPMGAMIRYGHELGRCGNCGRALTDETSRAAGIGPDCARHLGIDRSAYSDRAAADAAARVRGGTPGEGEDDGEATTEGAPTIPPRDDAVIDISGGQPPYTAYLDGEPTVFKDLREAVDVARFAFQTPGHPTCAVYDAHAELVVEYAL